LILLTLLTFTVSKILTILPWTLGSNLLDATFDPSFVVWVNLVEIKTGNGQTLD